VRLDVDAEARRWITRLAILNVLVYVLLFGLVLWSSYSARSNLVDSQRQGCERGKLDRAASARGWRIAQDARIADGNFGVAKAYAAIASELERRSRIDCSAVYPQPPVVQLFP
jgi:hypothetical protein